MSSISALSLAARHRGHRLRERVRFLRRSSLLIIDSCGVGSYVELAHEVGL
jgi:hypothetical protein